MRLTVPAAEGVVEDDPSAGDIDRLKVVVCLSPTNLLFITRKL